ncbi:hypothetical protein [Oceanithermus sp.]|uniref:hypothetical protein n=1 Tax=Oceanithermus sp. TaxID=2268145 RepID=UPI00260113FA|nr:hypothetical protein [Oceanithermus sp.]
MKTPPWWVQLRLYLSVVLVLFLLVVVGLNVPQRTRFWWFGVHEVATAWFLLGAVAVGVVLGWVSAWMWRRRGEG